MSRTHVHTGPITEECPDCTPGAFRTPTRAEALGIKPKAPVGRPPFPDASISVTVLQGLITQSQTFARDQAKLKTWLKEKRLFHILLQDHLATAPLPGASGVQLNAASSKLFLEMTEGLAAALKGVAEDE